MHYIINSGFAVGSPVDLRKYSNLRAMHIPGITSGDMFIQGALPTVTGVAPSSGDFARLLETRAVGSGPLRFATGAGSAWLAMPFGDTLPPWIRPEFASAQVDVRTLTLLVR